MSEEKKLLSESPETFSLIEYYKILHKRQSKLIIYFQKREDRLFYLTLLINVLVGFAGANSQIFNSFFSSIFVIAGLISLTWATVHYIQENSIYKNEINDKIMEIEEKLSSRLPEKETLIKGYNNIEFWKEDFYTFILKVAVGAASFLILFF